MRVMIYLTGCLLISLTIPLLAQDATPARPTLFIIGDSTVNNSTTGLQGWGAPIAALFDSSRLNVQNRARGGRSSRTFLTEGLWDAVLAELRPGDFVMMQFGHNDGGPLDSGRARASLKGIGDESSEITLAATGQKETVHTYGWYLSKFITDTQANGATPIVLSPIPRTIWNENKVARANNDYGLWSSLVAAGANALFINLNELIALEYEKAGPEKVRQDYFLQDHTHTTPAGAKLNAAKVIQGLRQLKSCLLNSFLLTDPALVVSQDGSGQFATVQTAINAIPANNSVPRLILIKPGAYTEEIIIPADKPFISFIGLGKKPADTRLTFNKSAKTLGADGKEIGTFRTASVQIDGPDFYAENISFENTYGAGAQALAVSVSGDRAIFYHCRFLGWQDTIYLSAHRHYFDHCTIEGHCDFIFGAATAWFEECHIHCRADGYITAASTPQEQPCGFVFSHCTITTADEVRKAYLGRPWRPYAAVTWLDSEIAAGILPAGWHNWKKPDNEKTARYSEFNSTGPGANPDNRVPWSKQLSKEQADACTVTTVLGGADNWNPASDNP